MKHIARPLLILVLSVTMISSAFLALPGLAEAARMGGGRSFGSHPSMSMPAPKPTARPAQRPAANAPMAGAAGAATASRGSGLFGFGSGMLGGFLLGSLFSGGHNQPAQQAVDANGNPVPAQQQSSGPGLFDLLILGLIIWLVVRFIRRRRGQAQPQGQQFQSPFGGQGQPSYNAGSNYGSQSGSQSNPYAGMQRTAEGTGTGWDALRSGGAGAAASFQANPRVPAGFDTEDFLRGAKMAYSRMQASWDRRDLNDIAQFATPAVMDMLQQQMAEDPTPSQTQILLINASLDSVEEFGSQDRAQVYFDVLMREDPRQAQPSRVVELWTFVRGRGTGSWKLDGIQQVE